MATVIKKGMTKAQIEEALIASGKVETEEVSDLADFLYELRQIEISEEVVQECKKLRDEWDRKIEWKND